MQRLDVDVAVVDHEGNVLGEYATAPGLTTTLRGRPLAVSSAIAAAKQGLEGMRVDAGRAAISKAGTAAFFSTQGNAFTPRTASFIIQQHFPPTVKEAPAGPLFGVQFSNLPCSDVNPRLPLGLSGDPGGFPLYTRGRAVGGVGVEGDGMYTVDLDPYDRDFSPEERIAAAATRGFEAPGAIRADRIFVGGLRLPFANTDDTSGPPPAALDPAAIAVTPHDAPPSRFRAVRFHGVRGTIDTARYGTIRASGVPAPDAAGLSAADVEHILTHGARRADTLRAAIRRPLGDRARVSIAVVDAAGTVLGIFRTADAPMFGFDVCVQKARGTAFASRADAGERLRAADLRRAPEDRLSAFADAAAADGIPFDGTIAFAERSIGFLARPFFPDGIDGTRPGPLSRPIDRWSVFSDGLQTELVKPGLEKVLAGQVPVNCADDPDLESLHGGIQIFAGAVPLYRGRTLVGAVGVSGDGTEQDDAVAAAASRGFAAPAAIRADRVRVRGVRLPYVKLPRRPTVK